MIIYSIHLNTYINFFSFYELKVNCFLFFKICFEDNVTYCVKGNIYLI